MTETILVLAGLGLLAVLGTLTHWATPLWMVNLGVVILTIGLPTGVPFGLWYHVILYRNDRPKDNDSHTMVDRPVTLAPHARPAAPKSRSRTLGWCYLCSDCVICCE